MVRVSGVQYEVVADACRALFEAGETPSFAKVYAAIGSRGGQQVVSDMIRRWRQDVASQVLAKRKNPALPAELVETSDQLIAQLWQGALARAEAAYTEQVHALAAARADWEARLARAAQKAAEDGRRILVLEGALATAEATREAREAALVELEARLRETQAALTTREAQGVELREDLARLEATGAAERARHDDALRTQQAQHAAAIQSKDDAHAAALAQVHRQVEADRRHFLLQTDELRQAHKMEAAQLREQLASARDQAEAYRRQAYAARDESARWQGKAELFQDELAAARKILAKVQRHREKRSADALPGSEPEPG